MNTGNRNVSHALWAVFFATAAVRIGFGAIMPVLPLYAQQHGLNTFMIAVMTNSYMVAIALFQSYAGHLGDKLGRRPIMLVGTWLYTVAAALFMFDGGPWFYVILRGLEGLGACAFGPTARAYIADLVPESERGRAYGKLMSFDMSGILLGPMIGGIAQSLAGPKAPFAICAILGLLAGVPLILLTRATRRSEQGAASVAPATTAVDVPVARLLQSPAFWAVTLPSLGFSYLNAMYSVIWSIFMSKVGANTFQISASFTVFAVPMVLLMTYFGALADKYGRPLFIAVGGTISALATLGYGIFPFPWALVGLSGLDGVSSSMFIPANQAYMANVAPSGSRGKFMGLSGAVSTWVTIGFVMLVGYLYERVPVIYIFGAGAVALLFSCGSAVAIMLRYRAEDLREALERA